VTPAGARTVLELPARLESAGAVREAAGALGEGLPGDAGADLVLVAVELFTNAVRHAGARDDDRVDVALERRPGAVRVEVRDPGAGFALDPRTPTTTQLGGRGLFLVEQLADRWGGERGDDGFLVWAELWTGGRTRHRRVPPRMLALDGEPEEAAEWEVPEGDDLRAMPDEELKDLLNLLAEDEREVSARRRALHRRIDPLRHELARRLAEPRTDAVLSRGDLEGLARMLATRMPDPR
jgi:anti-sigma regulatory factor (Ser/Thr protein kinase)